MQIQLQDRRFIARITLLIGIPFSVVILVAWAFSRTKDGWLFVVATILITFLVSFALALGTWFFFGRQGREPEQATSRRPEESMGLVKPVEYTARFGELATRNSERAFVRRGLRELWFWESVLPPALTVIAAALGYKVGAGIWFTLAAGVLSCILIAVPALLLIVRPVRAAAFVRRRPTQSIAFLPHGLVIRTGRSERVHAWQTIRRAWDVGPHFVLVGGRHLGIHLPKDGLPAEALEYVRRHAALTDGGPELVAAPGKDSAV
jgi:hypothetical protein